MNQLSQLLKLISFPFQLQEDDFLKIDKDLNLLVQVQDWWFSNDDVNLTALPKFYLNLFLNFDLSYLSKEFKKGVISEDSYQNHVRDILNTLYLTMINCNKLRLVRNLRRAKYEKGCVNSNFVKQPGIIERFIRTIIK